MGWVYDNKSNAWVLSSIPENNVQYDFSYHPNFSGIITTKNRPYNAENISYINQKLSPIPAQQRASILANIIEESGGDPLAVDKTNTYRGLLQWDKTRYVPRSTDSSTELDNQIQYILDTYQNTTDKVSWNKNGDAYKSAQDAYNHFSSETPTDYVHPIQYNIHRAFTRGYVRPSGRENAVDNRYKVYQQIYDIIK